MRARQSRRVATIGIGAVVVVVIVVALALRWAASEIRERIVDVLGPNGSAEQIDVGFHTVHLGKVRFGAPAGWPVPDALRADSIDIVPDWGAWFSHRLHLKSVVVDRYYLAVLRKADGKAQILPGLKDNVTQMTNRHDVENEPSVEPRRKTDFLIDRVEFHNGQFDFFDEKVATPAYPVHMSNFNATIENLHFPEMADRSTIAINAEMGGGTLALQGWMTFASRDSQITLALNGVDAKTLQPYLLKGQKTTIAAGTIDMSLNWTVQNDQLNAPGKLSINHLQVANQSGGPLGELATLPKKAAVEAMKDNNDRIDLDFVLTGNLNDPKFSVDDDLSKRVGAGIAKAVGVTVEGVGKTAGDAAKGIGGALKSLLGQ